MRTPDLGSHRALSLLLFPLLWASACTEPLPPPTPLDPSTFQADRAWADLMHQVELGPRPAGSAALEETRTWILSELRAMGLSPIREDFLADTPFGTYRMANLYADFPSSSSPSSGQQPTTPSSDDSDILILCSHFDTKTLTFRFLGANDGASSTAALLELARAITSHGRRPMTYRFLFLDGEEAMRRTWMDPDNTYGSRHHVQGIAERAENQRVRACVLLDMVGDKELQLTRDTFSHPDLLELFFQAARSNDLGDHVDGPPIPIKDDHLPFQRFEIPSCDLIDFEYGIYNEHWHRASDLPSNCSVESLATIGRIVLLGLPAVEQRFASR